MGLFDESTSTPLDDLKKAKEKAQRQALRGPELDIKAPPSEAEKKKQERDKKRSKDTYDLPPKIIEIIEELANEYHVPKSNIAALLLVHGILAYNRGEVEIPPLLKFSRSPRFEYLIRISDVPEIRK